MLSGNSCSILYNRGLYPEESFTKVKKYGLPLLLTQDEGVKTFIASLTAQLSGKFLIFLRFPFLISVSSRLLVIDK